jgi:hypothetical protein
MLIKEAKAYHTTISLHINMIDAYKDSPLWDGRRDPQHFFPRFFQSDVLLLAPLVNICAVHQPRVRLVTLPLKARGVCAAPCRPGQT